MNVKIKKVLMYIMLIASFLSLIYSFCVIYKNRKYEFNEITLKVGDVVSSNVMVYFNIDGFHSHEQFQGLSLRLEGYDGEYLYDGGVIKPVNKDSFPKGEYKIVISDYETNKIKKEIKINVVEDATSLSSDDNNIRNAYLKHLDIFKHNTVVFDAKGNFVETTDEILEYANGEAPKNDQK